ncbi:MAG TPA: lytic transglycosylase domain-containing protein [Polyangiaceae bacterium]|nr:lytic transglycosylase domain-containing protein [Polyangiaceae bacterium]
MTKLGVALALLGLSGALAASACSGDVEERRPPGLPARVPLRTAAERGPVGPPDASAARPAETDDASFIPLLATPALAEARAALEAGDSARAALAVQAAFAKAPPAADGVEAAQFLLARLRELSGDFTGAAASYDLAASAGGRLRGYAHLGAARCLLQAGEPRDALGRLDGPPPDGPLAVEAALVAADAARLSGDADRAVESLRTYLRAGDLAVEASRAMLDLAELLVRPPSPGAAPGDPAPSAREAIDLAERARTRGPLPRKDAARAETTIARALSLLPAAERIARARPDPAVESLRVRALVDARAFDEALAAADAALAALGENGRRTAAGCETELSRVRALGGLRRWGAGADEAGDVARHCTDPDVRARALFLAGKYADVDKRWAAAVKYYETLEREEPKHKLADDARVREALTYREMGAEGRFTELLTRLPDDYPDGDLVLDGMFQLALHRIEKGDWGSAATVLDRASTIAAPTDGKRGQEFAGRERYFRARALAATGDVPKSLDEYEAVVRELPLSYYALHAYSRLAEAAPARAAGLLEKTLGDAAKTAFSLDRPPFWDEEGFLRAIALLRVGDLVRAKRELDSLGVVRADAAPAVLWTIARLYGEAGAAKLSNDLARGLLTDYLVRWPAGDWQRAWEIAFPRPYHDLVQRETSRNDVPESLVYAVMREESSFDPDAESPAKAYGLMQLIVPTARLFGKSIGLSPDADALKRPAVNVALGARVLAGLTRSFPENPLLAIPGYNAGAQKPKRWLRERPTVDFDVWVELIPYLETRRYTKRVLASRASYAFLYAPSAAELALKLPIRLVPP